MLSTVNLNEIVSNIIIPIIQISFPIAVTFAISERIINIMLSFIRGDKYVKM